MEYKLIDRTPKEMQCLYGVCPAIYELTPEENQCLITACPSVFGDEKDNYYIVGKVVDAKSLGLEKRVGEGEVLIKVPKELIDNLKRTL